MSGKPLDMLITEDGPVPVPEEIGVMFLKEFARKFGRCLGNITDNSPHPKQPARSLLSG
jgi:hypothetical protein